MRCVNKLACLFLCCVHGDHGPGFLISLFWQTVTCGCEPRVNKLQASLSGTDCIANQPLHRGFDVARLLLRCGRPWPGRSEGGKRPWRRPVKASAAGSCWLFGLTFHKNHWFLTVFEGCCRREPFGSSESGWPHFRGSCALTCQTNKELIQSNIKQ